MHTRHDAAPPDMVTPMYILSVSRPLSFGGGDYRKFFFSCNIKRKPS